MPRRKPQTKRKRLTRSPAPLAANNSNSVHATPQAFNTHVCKSPPWVPRQRSVTSWFLLDIAAVGCEHEAGQPPLFTYATQGRLVSGDGLAKAPGDSVPVLFGTKS